MSEKVFERRPIVGVRLKNTLDEVDGGLRKMVGIHDLEVLYLLERLLRMFAIERRLADKELIGEDADCPDVNSVVINLPVEHFRRQVVRSATDGLTHVIWAVAAPAEVRDFDGTITVQQILWLQISVHHFF